MTDTAQPRVRRGFLLNSQGGWFVFGGLLLGICALWLANAYFAFTGKLPFFDTYIRSLLEVPTPQPENIWEKLGIISHAQVGSGFAERGPTGDTFGIVNSLFAGLAFLGLIYAILLQRQELHLVKEERDDTRAILDEQQKNLDLQNEIARQRAFETTLFNSLTLIAESRTSMQALKASGTPLSPRGVQFETLMGHRALAHHYVSLRRRFEEGSFDRAINEYNADLRDILEPHLAFILEVVRLSETSEVGSKLQSRRLLSSWLSSTEKVFLFLHAYAVNDEAHVQLLEQSQLIDTITPDVRVKVTGIQAAAAYLRNPAPVE